MKTPNENYYCDQSGKAFHTAITQFFLREPLSSGSRELILFLGVERVNRISKGNVCWEKTYITTY